MTRPRSDGDDPVEFPESSCVRETEKALLVVMGGDGDGEEKWIPKSVLAAASEVKAEGEEGVLAVKKWWARKESLTDE